MVASEADLLRAHGHSVRTHMTQNQGGLGGVVDLTKASWNGASARRLRSVVEQFSPDVVHVHNTWFRLSPSILVQERPVVMTIHNYRLICANAELFRDGQPCRLCIDGSPLNAIRYGCYHNALISAPAALAITTARRRGAYRDNVDVFLALTDFARSTMVAGGLAPDRIIVKPNFVEDPGQPYDYEERPDYVIFMGRMDHSKGVSVLADAFRRGGLPFRLIAVGDGPDRALLEGLDGVTTTGWLDRQDATELLAKARALIVPSLWYEGQPLVVLEAFARATPVIGTSHGGIGETIRAMDPVLRVRPADPSALRRSVLALADQAFAAQNSRNARVEYLNTYSPELARENLMSAYRLAMMGHRR